MPVYKIDYSEHSSGNGIYGEQDEIEMRKIHYVRADSLTEAKIKANNFICFNPRKGRILYSVAEVLTLNYED